MSAANERKERLWQAWYAGEFTREQRRQMEWRINAIVGEEKRRLVEELEDREREIDAYFERKVERCRKEWEKRTRAFLVGEEYRISWAAVEDDG